MPRVKKTSLIVKTATTRAASLSSIDKKLDLNNGLTLSAYEGAIQDTQEKLDAYNAQLSLADEARNVFQASERALRSFSERMLTGVGTAYGFDSDQYEKAGGTRKSERKRPTRKPKAA